MASLSQWEKKYYPNNTCNLYIMYTIISPKYVNYKKGISISSADNVCIFQPRYCIITNTPSQQKQRQFTKHRNTC